MSASGAVYHPPLGRLVTKQPKRFAGVARPQYEDHGRCTYLTSPFNDNAPADSHSVTVKTLPYTLQPRVIASTASIHDGTFEQQV